MRRVSDLVGSMVGPESGPPDGMPWELLCVAQDGPIAAGEVLIYDRALRAYRCGERCVQVGRVQTHLGRHYEPLNREEVA